jgi:hypothetical protein
MKKLTAPLFIIVSITFCQVPTHLLPGDNDVSGWVVDNNSACPSAEVTTDSGLYDAIDGGAGTYVSRGFEAGVFEGYTNGSTEICLEIYSQTNADSAGALYQATAIGEYRVISGLGDGARLDTLGLFSNALEMIIDKYFVRFIINSKEASDVEAAKALGQVVADKHVAVEKAPVLLLHSGSDGALVGFPDPASQGCFFEFRGPVSGRQTCNIYDCRGRLVRMLALSKIGFRHYRVHWNGLNGKSERVMEGRYMARITGGGETYSCPFVVQR